MALVLGRSGRGCTISSATRQLHNMYKEKVSFEPRLVLNNHQNYETTAYICKKSGKYGSVNIYWKLYNKKLKSEISSAFYLAGNYDFFITTRRENIELDTIGLEICSTTKFFDPIYTVPTGWNHSMQECIRAFFAGDFAEKRLPRKIRSRLNWSDLDWRIYLSTRGNLRKPLKHVSREVDASSYTVRKRLAEVVVPSCTIANFFFPLGYDHYDKIFMHINSRYESSIVTALRKFPCTAYVYPLDEEIICILFYDGIKNILTLTKKLEEKGLVSDLLLSVPLASLF